MFAQRRGEAAEAQRGCAAPPAALPIVGASSSDLLRLAAGSCLQAERDLMPVLMATKDHAEAVAAFIEKRKPVFTGS